MGCSSCSTNSNGVPGGCKNNGTCGTDGCNKLTVFDWLSNMKPVGDQEHSKVIEVRFKNGRKEYYNNSSDLTSNLNKFSIPLIYPPIFKKSRYNPLKAKLCPYLFAL